MRFSGFLAKAKSARVIVGGAVLALGLVGVGLANADAASTWTAQTASNATFTCLSRDCQAGGVGPVKMGDLVGPSPAGQVGGKAIGAWPRTVIIQCKVNTVFSGWQYHGTVRDRNWAGQWSFLKKFLATSIDDSGFPTC